MALPTIDVAVRLGVAVSGEFIVGTSLVDGTDVIGDGLNSVASDSYAINVTRGRFSQLWDAIGAGTCTASLWNNDRDYDPENVSGTYYGELVPGRLVKVTANGIDVFTGYVSDWGLEYSVEGLSTANVVATDALGMFAQAQLNAWTSTVTTVDGKLHEICDKTEVSWPVGDRDFAGDSFSTFGVGTVILGSNAVSWGTNALTAAQTVAKSNLGYLYSSRSGVLTYRSRQTLEAVGDGPQATFADDGTGIAYQGIAASMGSDVLFARVATEAAGGSAQTATVADLAAWIVSYGPVRSLSIGGLLLSTNAQALTLAQELLAKYDTPVYRISEITVDLTPLSTAQQNELLALDIADQVSVTFTPNGVGAAIVQEPWIQGIRHTIGTERHTMTLSLIIN